VEYGDERIPEMRDFLSTISPVNHAHKIVKPMLIIQGKNDPRVPYTESEQMVAAIRKNQGKVWYVLASDEGHGFRKKANRDYQMAAIALFVKQHLVN
jgi:dipeptidyl aminopeptidase/acylaminoacyl peptidase